MSDKVFIRKTIDFSKIYDKGFTVILTVAKCPKHMQTAHSFFSHLIPLPSFLIFRIIFFKFLYGINWTHRYQADFVLLKVATLCEHNQVKNIYINIVYL